MGHDGKKRLRKRAQLCPNDRGVNKNYLIIVKVYDRRRTDPEGTGPWSNININRDISNSSIFKTNSK